MMEETRLLLGLQKQIGDLASSHERETGKVNESLAHLTETVGQVLSQATKTNGRVTKMETVTIPMIKNALNDVPSKSDCESHRELTSKAKKELTSKINETEKKARGVFWATEKPARLITILFVPAMIVQLFDITLYDIIEWGEKFIKIVL